MIILHILTRLLKAGSEENTLLTCQSQVADGHSVFVLYGKEFDSEIERRFDAVGTKRIRVDNLIHPISLILDMYAIKDIARIIDEIQADVVHTHQSKAGVLGRIAARIAKAKCIIHGVHILPFVNVGKLQELIYVAAERYCAGFTDAFVDVSPTVRSICIEKKIGTATNHFVAFSAMDVDKFKCATYPDDWRDLLGVAMDGDKPPTAVMVAAFEPRKRQRELIQALPEAFSGSADWRVLFVGRGELEAEVRDLTRELKLEGHVKFSGYRDDPEKLIALADVCFLTSQREGLPRVVVQYIAAGKPVVVSAVPGIEDIVKDGVSAVITPPGDVRKAAFEIAHLLETPAKRAHLAKGAAETVIDAWRIESMDRSIRDAYRFALSRRR